MPTHVYEAVLSGRYYRLASQVDLGDEAVMGFVRTNAGWQPTALARTRPTHSTSMTFVPAMKLTTDD
ncbi:MAG: hypothetical protein ACR2PA_19510 [Hyphomicrobiaceae bacterium]